MIDIYGNFIQDNEFSVSFIPITYDFGSVRYQQNKDAPDLVPSNGTLKALNSVLDFGLFNLSLWPGSHATYNLIPSVVILSLIIPILTSIFKKKWKNCW